MKRCRITVQITHNDRRRLERLVFDHKGDSISDVVRTALQAYLRGEGDKRVGE